MLRYAVEWALDSVDALERLGKPRLDFGTENDVDRGCAGSKGGGGSR